MVEGSSVIGDIAAAVPSDDAGRWQVLLFVGPNCAPCEALKRDMAGNANLRSIAAADGSGWGHLLVYDQAQASQRYRFADYQVSQTPTLVITPPPRTKQWPYIQAFRRTGYDGQARSPPTHPVQQKTKKPVGPTFAGGGGAGGRANRYTADVAPYSAPNLPFMAFRGQASWTGQCRVLHA